MKIRNFSGLTYLEVIAGIIIISFILVGMNSIFGIGIRNNKKAEKLNIALGFAQELMEQTKAMDFNNIKSIEETNVNGYKKSLNVISKYEDNKDKKLVTVTVSDPFISDVSLSCVMVDPKI